MDAAKERANRILGEAEIFPNHQRILEYDDAGVTDLSVRLPIGNGRDELIASKRRTREVIAGVAADMRT